MLKDSAVRAEMSLVTITTGLKASFDAGSWLVPKKELVGVVQILLQSRRIRVAETLLKAATLVKELENFRAKVAPSRSSDLLADGREAPHDDLVLAVVVAAWYAERFHSYAKCAYQERRGGGGDRPVPARAVAVGQIPSQSDGRGQGGLPVVFAGISSCLGRCDRRAPRSKKFGKSYSPPRAFGGRHRQQVRPEPYGVEHPGYLKASHRQFVPAHTRPSKPKSPPDERAGVCCREVADARPGITGR
jgi:hypothetical protein